MADAIRHAYADLFKVNTKANEMSKQDIINKLKTLSQGKISDSVLDKMAMTFTALVKHADFKAQAKPTTLPSALEKAVSEPPPVVERAKDGISLGGLVYNIQIVLPDSRDPAVYDALFQSLRTHLL